MNPETIKALASEIANQTILNNWVFYVVLFSITIGLSAVTVAISSYIAKRSENLAIKSDFEDIKNQLQQTTTVTESIKVDINKMAERSEKLEWLKREKLEHYHENILKVTDYLSATMNNKFFDIEDPDKEDPINKASMLQKLYLPELDRPHALLLTQIAKFRQWLADEMQQRIDLPPNISGKKPPPSKELMSKYRTLLGGLNAAVIEIEKSAQELARGLNKV